MTERETPERLFQHLDDLDADIVDQFASRRHGTALVVGTLQDVLAKRQLAYERDPNLAEDDVEEPSTTGRVPVVQEPDQRSSQDAPIRGSFPHSGHGEDSHTDAAGCVESNRVFPAAEKSAQGLVGR
jgi:hypothetical protein